VLLGGAAGTFLGADALDMPLSFDGVRERGATLGSGAVMVFDAGTDLRAVVRRIARFFRDESCGQCVPCRIGTVRQEELVERLAARRPNGTTADEVRLHRDLAAVMRDASICGLGQSAANAVESAIRLGIFAEEEVTP
jgi:NADH-quinone oxidoreductase subunit F